VGGFTADWLALREPADRRARSAALIARAAMLLGDAAAPVVCDLGAGTGAAARAFAPAFPASTQWVFVDSDPATLAVAAASGRTVCTDLAAAPAAWPSDCALVTATALFDLAAPGWIDRLAGALAADRLPLLACLTYDGTIEIAPEHPGDAEMIAAFNAHQRLDKGLGGPAAGPDAAATLADAVRRRGYRIWEAATPWRLAREADAALIEATLDGWAGAAAETGRVTPRAAAEWRAARAGATERLVIGHRDIFAAPPG